MSETSTAGSLGSLLPPLTSSGGKGGAEPPPLSGPTLGAALAQPTTPASPASPQGRIINPNDLAAEEDPHLKKAETLGDLRSMFPELQREGSGWRLFVERTFPKTQAGASTLGIMGPFSAFHEGHDVLDNEGFFQVFGWGHYTIWVEGPSRSSYDPVTGAPKILRKTNSEIKHIVPERPKMTQTPTILTPAGSTAAVDLERAKTEGSVIKMALDHAFGAKQGAAAPVPDAGTTSLAATAIQAQSQASLAALEAANERAAQAEQRAQNLQDQIIALSSRPQSSTATEQVLTSVLDRSNDSIDAIRRHHDEEKRMLISGYEDRLLRLQTELSNFTMRAASERESLEQKLRTEMDNAVDRERRLGADMVSKEREHLLRLTELSTQDSVRNNSTMTTQQQLTLEALKHENARNLEVLRETHNIVIQSKDNEINRLVAELTVLKTENQRYRDKENQPFEQQLLKVVKTQELLESLAPKHEEKAPGMAEKMMEAMMPAAAQALAPMIPAILAKYGGLQLPGPMAMPPGQPPPRQIQQGGAPPQPQQQRQGQPPAPQQQERKPKVKPPFSDTVQVRPFEEPRPQGAPPREAPPQGGHHVQPNPADDVVAYRNAALVSREQLGAVLPNLEAELRGAIEAGASTRDFVTRAIQFIPEQLRVLSAWIDGENLGKLLNLATGKQGIWVKPEAREWLMQAWVILEAELEKMPPPAQPDASSAVPSTAS